MQSSHPSPILSDSGPAVVLGGGRFSQAEEAALNLLIRKSGGEDQGIPIYKIGWAMEDNHSTWDNSTGSYKYDPDKITPICFHENQGSYHFLAWEPPSESLEYEQLKGFDHSKGTWNCLFHFLDPKTGEPYSLAQIRVQLVEIIIPTLRQMSEIAIAARHGFQATVKRLRQQTIEKIKTEEKRKEKDYEKYAEGILEEGTPAFEGHGFSAAGGKRRQFSDRKPGEVVQSTDIPAAIESQAPIEQPQDFSFSVKSRRPKE